MYAVIEFAGHQYKVKEGDKFKVNSLDAKEGDKIKVEEVLMTFDEKGEKVEIGAPTLSGVTVELKVLDHFKGDKVRVFKMKPKKRYKVNKGHRQQLTLVEVTKIGAGSTKKVAEKPKAEKKEEKEA